MSLKQLSMRIRSTTSTAKITKAMKMVAAAKLKTAERNLIAAKPFTSAFSSIFDPVLTPDEEYSPESTLAVAMSSDKGLCGGINSRVVKEMKIACDTAESAGTTPPKIMIVGGKVRDGLQRTHSNHIAVSIDEAYGRPVNFSLAAFVTEQMLAQEGADYSVTTNIFKSVITQEVETQAIKGPEALGESGVMDDFEFEGEKEDILANMYQFHLATQVYSAMLNNTTSELASKMTAMDSATTNAEEMISKLTIIYNRKRQAKVTTELTEIVAGAESV